MRPARLLVPLLVVVIASCGDTGDTTPSTVATATTSATTTTTQPPSAATTSQVPTTVAPTTTQVPTTTEPPRTEVTADQIAGVYTAIGTNPPPVRTTYEGEVLVTSDGESQVTVFWRIAGDEWTGVGTLTGDGELFVHYEGTFQGSGTWVLQPDGSFVGTWQIGEDPATGTETWLRR